MKFNQEAEVAIVPVWYAQIVGSKHYLCFATAL
jgi:hypothetical protein